MAVGVNVAVGGSEAVGLAVGKAFGVETVPLVGVGRDVEVNGVVAAGWAAVLVGNPGDGLAPGAG